MENLVENSVKSAQKGPFTVDKSTAGTGFLRSEPGRCPQNAAVPTFSTRWSILHSRFRMEMREFSTAGWSADHSHTSGEATRHLGETIRTRVPQRMSTDVPFRTKCAPIPCFDHALSFEPGRRPLDRRPRSSLRLLGYEGRRRMNGNHLAVWDSVMASLRETIPDSSYLTWLAQARPLALENGTMAIRVPDAFTKDGIEQRYRLEIERIASEACEGPISLDVQIVSDDTPAAVRRLAEETRSIPQGGFPLNVEYTFESFVRGKNNHLAHAASEAVARAVIQAEEKTYNPLFIYGSVGLGKTHLLQAIGNQVLRTSADRTVVYTTSERFAIELINAIRDSSTGAFREKYRRIDLLLIDDVHFLQGKEATQEELFHTFNELYGAMKQIVLSSDRPPEDLSGLQERLVSRFRWGLVADIQPPDLETRIAILREKAVARGLTVDDDVLELIARRISSNVRALEGALVKALACAQLQGERLTPQRLETVLPKEGQRPRLTISHIKDEVAIHYGLKSHDLESSSRKKEISQARHVAIFLSRTLTDHSFPAIAREFGNRDHTTIMHSYSKVKEQLDETPLLQAEIGELQESLAARFALPR